MIMEVLQVENSYRLVTGMLVEGGYLNAGQKWVTETLQILFSMDSMLKMRKVDPMVMKGNVAFPYISSGPNCDIVTQDRFKSR